MNVLLIGASGTGKTTIAEDIKEYYVIDADEGNLEPITVQIVPSVGRSAIAGMQRGLEGSSEVENVALTAHTQNLARYTSAADPSIVSVFPRSALDVMAYLEAKGAVDTDVYDRACEAVHQLEQSIDIAFFLPKEFDTEDDGVRSSAVEVDKLAPIYKGLSDQLYDDGIAVYDLTGTPEERLVTAIDVIEEYRDMLLSRDTSID